MRKFLLLTCALLALTDCGIRRPLIAPEDVPEHEAARQKRLQKMNAADQTPEAVDTDTPWPINMRSSAPAGNTPVKTGDTPADPTPGLVAAPGQ